MSAEVAAMLFESDRRYFAAGAESLPFDGGVLRWMPGLQHLAAGCVAEVADVRASRAASEAAASVGAPLLRLYQTGGEASGWAREGFLAANELAYARRPEPLGIDPVATIRPVLTEGDWALKEALAAGIDGPPDGKPASARDWTALERRKSDAGYARFYLAEIDGRPCGSLGLAACGSLLRLKNVAVAARDRGRGVGRAMVDFALRHARNHGFAWAGVFGLEDGPGSRLYAHCGFALAGVQTEWTRASANGSAVAPETLRPAGLGAAAS